MRRLVLLLALVCAAPAHGQDTVPQAFCWDFDRLGGDGADLIEGTSDADHVAGFGGADQIRGFGGDDCVSAGAGDDTVELGHGDDEALGRGGHDGIDGGAGDDVLLGGLGADRLIGGEGDDALVDDPVDRAGDTLQGGEGDDLLYAGLGADTLQGGPGDDMLQAANGAIDTLDCGDGVDRAVADLGDRLTGCEQPVIGYRPAVRRAPLAGGARTTFTLRWDGAGPVQVEPAGYAPARPGCLRGAWRVRVSGTSATLRWAGRRPPCPGRYEWRIVRTDPTAERIDCEIAADRLFGKGSPPERGCARREAVGEAAYTVAGSKP